MAAKKKLFGIEKPQGMTVTEELVWALNRVLTWPNPSGQIQDAYIPGWLSAHAQDALRRFVKEKDGYEQSRISNRGRRG